MIKILTKTVKEDLPEMIVNLDDVKFIKYLPTCPQCKQIEDVVIFNVTNKIYECSKCNLRFRIPSKTGLSFWKRY
jgi:ribosomal protein L37AE/L43A